MERILSYESKRPRRLRRLFSKGARIAACGAFVLLLFITFKPLIRRGRKARGHLDGAVPALAITDRARPVRICVTVDFSAHDQRTVAEALAQGGREAGYVLIHITESAVARYLGSEAEDREVLDDEANLQQYVQRLKEAGYSAEARNGTGDVVGGITTLVNEARADLLVMGAHGHRGLRVSIAF